MALRPKNRAAATWASISAAFRWMGRALDRVIHPLEHRQTRLSRLNREFLTELGFSEIDDGNLSYVDGDGNALRLIQTSNRMLTFIVIGRRRSRAYIKLNEKGRYVQYTGPLKV